MVETHRQHTDFIIFSVWKIDFVLFLTSLLHQVRQFHQRHGLSLHNRHDHKENDGQDQKTQRHVAGRQGAQLLEYTFLRTDIDEIPGSEIQPSIVNPVLFSVITNRMKRFLIEGHSLQIFRL